VKAAYQAHGAMAEPGAEMQQEAEQIHEKVPTEQDIISI
jgi:hypothetical protein